MSMVKCPKCGRVQPLENTECAQCRVIFKKIIKPDAPVQVTPILIPGTEPFLPPVGLSKHAEITILNIIAYIYLILGIGGGVGILITGEGESAFLIGVSVIIGAVITSMFFFITCTVAKKIVSIDTRYKTFIWLCGTKTRPKKPRYFSQIACKNTAKNLKYY